MLVSNHLLSGQATKKKAGDKYLKCTTCKAGLKCRKGVEDLAGHDVQYGKHRTRRSFQESKKFLVYQT